MKPNSTMMHESLTATTGEVDAYLLRQFADSAGVLSFSRGSSALYALFLALRSAHGQGEVIIPGICCETVAMAALFAGLRPVIADVDPNTLCISLDSLRTLLRKEVRAVVVVHAFGCIAPVSEIALLCKGMDIVLIEDLAHAAGAVDSSGRKLGESLDCSLFSFSEGKIIKGKGGALIFNRDHTLLELVRETRSSLPAPLSSEQYALLELSLRNLTHGLHDLARANTQARIGRAFLEAAGSYVGLIARGADSFPLSRIAASIQCLPETNRERMRRYWLYEQGIQRPGAHVMKIPPMGTCWRTPVLFGSPQEAQAITRALRDAGIHASNHYFPLDRLLFDQSAPGNSLVGETIVNLWVDDTISDSMVHKAIDVINSLPLTCESLRQKWIN
jgi:dTDP-4-amino-4,6-dideoxygalactose transaminase